MSDYPGIDNVHSFVILAEELSFRRAAEAQFLSKNDEGMHIIDAWIIAHEMAPPD